MSFHKTAPIVERKLYLDTFSMDWAELCFLNSFYKSVHKSKSCTLKNLPVKLEKKKFHHQNSKISAIGFC